MFEKVIDKYFKYGCNYIHPINYVKIHSLENDKPFPEYEQYCLICDQVYVPNSREDLGQVKNCSRVGILVSSNWRPKEAGWKEINEETFSTACSNADHVIKGIHELLMSY